MTKAFPPRRPRGRWWTALAVALGLLGSSVVPSLGQAPGPGGSNKAGSDKDKSKAKDAEKGKAEATPAPAPVEKPEGPERWEDPRAAEAMGNTFEIAAPPLSGADRLLIKGLGTGQGTLDTAAIDRYVKSLASDLTRRANIKALTDLGGNPSQAKAVEEAARALLEPLAAPPSAANQRFRQVYVARLIEAFKPIWKGNYHSRTMAMIVLSRTGDPQALPVFTAQLNDPDQVAIVKLLAAVGITNVTRNGRVAPEGSLATEAAKSLSGFLRRETDTFWPAQFRALEALGALRLATPEARGDKADFADTAAAFLNDPKAPPDVRVWAAWALGMMQVPPQVRDYNFPRIAHAAGQAAADLGAKIAAVPDRNLSTRVVRLADLLVQLNLAFAGESDIRNSGLAHANHPAAASAQGYIGEVEKRVRAVTKASIELSNAAGTLIEVKRAALLVAVNDLKAFLAKPPAGGVALYAGGPESSILDSKVAGDKR